MIKIENALKEDAPIIARMIMTAMTDECCLWFTGPEHTLDEFHTLMASLVEEEETQYSYRNTFVAVDDSEERHIAGICVSYDGGELHRLREPFFEKAKQMFGIDHHGIDDETQAGELYIDSLCVDNAYRRRGIATLLLNAAIEKARGMALPAALLVDKGNPNAEILYNKVGFRYANDTIWGGHEMKHLVKR